MPAEKDFFSPDESEVPSQAENIVKTSTDEEETIYPAVVTSEEKTNENNLGGNKIESIKINGLKTLDSEFVMQHIKTKTGSVLDSCMLQNDLQTLFATGYFTDKISVEPAYNYDSTVDLVFSLEENVVVENVVVSGNEVISNEELESITKPLIGLPQNLNEINKIIDEIHKYYAEKGYILAQVSSIDDNSAGELCLNIQEGIINEIKISGNEKTKDYIIQRNIMTQTGTVYNEEYLKKDLAKVFSTQIFEEVDRDITPC